MKIVCIFLKVRVPFENYSHESYENKFNDVYMSGTYYVNSIDVDITKYFFQQDLTMQDWNERK